MAQPALGRPALDRGLSPGAGRLERGVSAYQDIFGSAAAAPSGPGPAARSGATRESLRFEDQAVTDLAAAPAPSAERPSATRPSATRPRKPRVLLALVVAVGGALLGVSLSRSPARATSSSRSRTAPRQAGAQPRPNRPSLHASTPRQATTARGLTPGTVPQNTVKPAAPAPRPSAQRTSTRSSHAPTTTQVPASAVSGHGPVITALLPDTGRPGQTLTIIGSGLTSANGEIVAMFGAQEAPTRCPSAERCLVTVPSVAPGSSLVRLRTAAGFSDGLSFHER